MGALTGGQPPRPVCRDSGQQRYDERVRFDDAFLDELKSRLRLSDVIGKTVKLRRQGREFAGLSPFSKEKSPSFFVNDDKGFFHDFSSAKHGDLITFLQETERLSFVEAVERLAGEAGMALPTPDPRAAESEKKIAGLADWLELAAAWFEAELRRPAGREARDYLIRRGLPEDDWKRFRLGYAGRPHHPEGLPDHQGRPSAGAGRRRHADLAGGWRRAVRPLPRADHLPDRRSARPHRLVRRPGARSAGQGQVPQRPRDRGLPQRPYALRPARSEAAAARRRRRRGARGGRRLHGRD